MSSRRSSEAQQADSNVDERRKHVLQLLAETRRETGSRLSGIDPGLSVHDDGPAWRARDVIGHLGVWNGEAARSLEAHARGEEYQCISSEGKYDDYNAAAAKVRAGWPMQQVWDEYEASADQLQRSVEMMPAEKWNNLVVFPWGEQGTVRRLVKIMMQHEREHRDAIMTTAKTSSGA